MDICYRPITYIFKDEVQAPMHQTAITGQMDLGSWLPEMWMLWLSVLKKPLTTEQRSCVKHSWFYSAL